MLEATPQIIGFICKSSARISQSIKFLGLSLNLPVAVILPRAFLLLSIQFAIAGRGASASWFQSGDDQRLRPLESARDNSSLVEPKKSSPLYECELSFLQVDLSLIKFSINYLQLEGGNNSSSGGGQLNDGFSLTEINLDATVDELAANSTLNAQLPFVFFINGFNTFAPEDEIDSTWMYQVAKSFAVRAQEFRPREQPVVEMAKNKTTQIDSGFLSWLLRYFPTKRTKIRADNQKEQHDQEDSFASGRNVIFLTWSIPDLFASNLFAMIPAYYRTVANYDLIVDHVARTMAKFVQFVELNNQFMSARSRSEHYSKYQFYGHSLGSHILSDAILRVFNSNSTADNSHDFQQAPSERARVQPKWQFGKLMGLDPATPCFVSKDYGISSWRVQEAVREVAVLHSNAGFAGVPNERANVEIVLNGGTFQPGCAWYDFACSHVRSTDILSYIDDDCQMVAYKCTSYNHFKLGACEVCPYDDQSSSLSSHRHREKQGAGGGHCALVNLPEQHRERPEVLTFVELANNKTRQLAQASDLSGQVGTTSSNWFSRQWSRYRSRADDESKVRSEIESQANQIAGTTKSEVNKLSVEQHENGTRSKANYFHYVNTNPNFRFGRKTHCLQHYQLRLLIYHDDDDLLQQRNKCKLSTFYLKPGDEIKLRLFYETAADGLNGSRSPQDMDQTRAMSKLVKLNPIVADVFLTALVNFEAAPKLFVGAEIENLNLVELAKCYKRQNATSGGPKFVLDIAFMSHVRAKIRHAFSSVLCDQLDLNEPDKDSNGTTESQASKPSERQAGKTSGRNSMLSLCKQSELKDVSAKINKLLDQIRLQLLDETWKVSLLNSLFSLFTEWEPF